MLDLGSLMIKLDSPITGFQHDFYPIYLNQNQQQMPLTVQYSLFGTINGVPNIPISDPTAHGIRIEPILRYGRTPNTVPQPSSGTAGNAGGILRVSVVDADSQGDSAAEATGSDNDEFKLKLANQVVSDSQPNAPASSCHRIKFHISRDCLSDGGFETTVRLRLLVIHESFGLVLAFVDSPRFAVMTREVPSGPNLLARLRTWGLPIHPDDQDSLDIWKTQQKPQGKRTKLVEPVAFEIDDEQTLFEPSSICLPSGQSYLTMAGITKVVDLIRGGSVSYDHQTISLLSHTFSDRSPMQSMTSSSGSSVDESDIGIDQFLLSNP